MTSEQLQPPTLGNVTWRALHANDLSAVAALTAACLANDGGLPFASAEGFLKPKYAQPAPFASIGGFQHDGGLIACSAIQPALGDETLFASMSEQVHPEWRGQGIEEFLLQWSIAQGRALLAQHANHNPGALRIASETLTPEDDARYVAHGFTQVFGELIMRRVFAAPLPEAQLKQEFCVDTWKPELAEQFFAAYDASFRDRPGFPNWSAAQWIEWISDDEDFRPDLSLLVRAGDMPVAFVASGSGWITQVGVRPEYRGTGVADALMVEAMRRMQAEGTDSVMLTVNLNNPRATRVYERLGFARVGVRARYVREV